MYLFINKEQLTVNIDTNNLKAQLTSAVEKAKPYAQQALAYAKQNPDTVLLGLCTLLLMDMEDSLEDIEAASELSAAVDYTDYVNGR